ncbi:MAG: hypothetical protein HN831_04725 [Waddliaceae bacterium]|nr:hypothetical protein [Waddliaceae bacterium]MBT6929223.1 hypothetical protein [Waddliaceae bacterium]MBT7264759.1 hypothetical protein [Waddliaceae bacterium]MBT7461704.1 hypothetical protein [Waddliaceae bacterium]
MPLEAGAPSLFVQLLNIFPVLFFWLLDTFTSRPRILPTTLSDDFPSLPSGAFLKANSTIHNFDGDLGNDDDDDNILFFCYDIKRVLSKTEVFMSRAVSSIKLIYELVSATLKRARIFDAIISI